MIINGNLKFASLGFGELQNAVMENMDTVTRNAAAAASVTGQLVYDTDQNIFYFSVGGSWSAFGTGGGVTALQTEVDAIETASGLIFKQADGTFDSVLVDAALTNVTGSTNLLDVLVQLNTAIDNAAGVDTLPELSDVTNTATSGAIDGDFLAFNGTTWDNTGFASLTANDLLQWNGTDWVNVAATSIGEFGFKTISGDTGSAVADVLGDTLTLTGAAIGGITTIATDTPDGVTFALTPIDLATSAVTLVGSDFLVVSDSADSATTVGQKTTITKLIQDLDIVTATTNGILVRTAADTYTSRTITSGSTGLEGISIVDGDGILGNPIVGLDITGLTAEAGTAGATDIFAIFDGTNNVKLTLAQLNAALIANGTALPDLTDTTITAVADGDFLVNDGSGKWINEGGATARTSLDVYSTTESDNNFVDVTGDTMSGVLNMGTNAISNVAAPTTGTDAANKAYVDALVAGLTWKNSAVAATTANIDLATGGLLTIDSVVTVAGDRVLVKDQTLPAANGVYIAAVGTWLRATDFDSVSPIDEINSAAIFVEQGTVYQDTGWTVTSDVVTIDTDAITFTQFNGANGITDGIGLIKTGNTLDINMGAGIVALPSDEVGIDLFADGGLRLSDTVGGAASVLTGAKLRVLLDGSTLTLSATGVKVSGSGITETELNTSVAGDGIQGGGGVALSLDLKAASGLVIDTGELSLTTIPNAALANAAITIAADSGVSEVADLGETLTIAGGTGVATVVSATNTVTVDLAASIDDLTDVDTTTAAPSTNDTLIWDGTNWVPGNPVNASSELTDVTAAATVAGQVLVSDGTDYTPRQIQYVDTVSAASTTWTVVHGLNQQFVNVTIYDSANSVIIPQSIVATDANTTTVTFNTAITGTAVIMGAYGLAAV